MILCKRKKEPGAWGPKKCSFWRSWKGVRKGKRKNKKKKRTADGVCSCCSPTLSLGADGRASQYMDVRIIRTLSCIALVTQPASDADYIRTLRSHGWVSEYT